MRVRRDGEPSRTREAAAALARTTPEALLELYETALGQVAPLKAERFDGLRELAEVAYPTLAKNPAKG